MLTNKLGVNLNLSVPTSPDTIVGVNLRPPVSSVALIATWPGDLVSVRVLKYIYLTSFVSDEGDVDFNSQRDN